MKYLRAKVQTAQYLSKNMGPLWAKRFLRNLSAERILALVHELERNGMAVELDLEIPSWRAEQVVATAKTLELARTITIPESPPLHEEAHGWHPYRARELQGVTLDVDSGLAFAGEQVIAQSGSGTRASRDASFVSGATVRINKTKPIILNRPIAPLGDVHHHYHVMLETLPRMLHARALNPEVHFVTSSEIANRYQELFEELGLRIQHHQPGSVLLGHPLVLVDQPDLFWPRQADLTALRSAFGTGNVQPTRDLYISRGTNFRQPAKESELQDTLHDAGFECLDLADYSIKDQWAIAQTARAVAGPHGASLWIAAGMQPHSKLLELSSGEYFENCYRRIATLNELNYQFVHMPGSESQAYGNALALAPKLKEYFEPH